VLLGVSTIVGLAARAVGDLGERFDVQTFWRRFAMRASTTPTQIKP